MSDIRWILQTNKDFHFTLNKYFTATIVESGDPPQWLIDYNDEQSEIKPDRKINTAWLSVLSHSTVPVYLYSQNEQCFGVCLHLFVHLKDFRTCFLISRGRVWVSQLSLSSGTPPARRSEVAYMGATSNHLVRGGFFPSTNLHIYVNK